LQQGLTLIPWTVFNSKIEISSKWSYQFLPMTPNTTASTRLADTIASNLENRILEGSLKSGDRLPSERALAIEMGVSRPSLREAIQKLVLKGLLFTRHGGGTHVTDRLESHFVDPWQDMLKGHPLLHRDLLEFRQMLESQAATLAAQRATDVDISQLEAAYSNLQTVYAKEDLTACIDADVAFHQAIADASHNVLIGHLTSSLMRVIHGHVTNNLAHLQTHPPRWQMLQSQHGAIWEAIRQHQPQQAGQAASAHIEFVRQNIEDNAIEFQRRSSALRRVGG
jgi:GntR family transcriptional repressor for pyruvate dehydrogenase complex